MAESNGDQSREEDQDCVKGMHLVFLWTEANILSWCCEVSDLSRMEGDNGPDGDEDGDGDEFGAW